MPLLSRRCAERPPTECVGGPCGRMSEHMRVMCIKVLFVGVVAALAGGRGG